MRRATITGILAGLWLFACGRERVVRATPELQVMPAALDFADVYLKAPRELEVTVTNRGLASEPVGLELVAGDDYALAAASAVAGAGVATAVKVRFTPSAAGARPGLLRLSWSTGGAEVPLTGNGRAWPACTAGPCESSTFDPVAGACVTAALPEGTACDAHDACLTGTTCLAGLCLGQRVDCDDGDLCTLDSCSSTLGCLHAPIGDQCQGDDPCRAYACDPKQGCVGSPVPDGTACSTHRACLSQGACLQGSCQEVPVPDGTACTLDWAPCAGDASCQKGQCDSPTADGWTPGQVLWTYDLHGDPGFHNTEVQAVDSAGNSYLLDYQHSEALSLDVCGGFRWSQSYTTRYPYDLMLSGDAVLVQEGGLMVSRAAADGTERWRVDVAQLLGECPDGGACGATLDGKAFEVPPALSNSGQIMIASNTWGATPYQLQLASLTTSGQVSWVKQPVPQQAGLVVGLPALDPKGNFYLYSDDYFGSGKATLWSFDTSGQLRFSQATLSAEHLSVGPGFVLDLSGSPSTAWSASGTAVYTLSTSLVRSPQFDSSGVVDASGATIFWPGASYNPNPGLARVDAKGALLASVSIPGFPLTELTLDEAGRVYVIGAGANQRLDLWCWDGVSPTLDFTVDLGPLGLPSGVEQAWGQNLFVSHGMLVANVGNVVTAIFVGKHGESQRAWWPRGNGGTNANRKSPPPGL